MSKYQEIRTAAEEKRSLLFKEVGLFFAFSDEQFSKNKTPLTEGDKYVSIGMGGYLPKSKVDEFTKGMKEIGKWTRDEIKSKKLEKKEIAFELANHEAYYTGELEDTYDALGGVYTMEQIREVYNENLKYQE